MAEGTVRQRPIFQERIHGIQGTIFLDSQGRPRSYIKKSYKDKTSGNWKEVNFFWPNELHTISELCAKMIKFLEDNGISTKGMVTSKPPTPASPPSSDDTGGFNFF